MSQLRGQAQKWGEARPWEKGAANPLGLTEAQSRHQHSPRPGRGWEATFQARPDLHPQSWFPAWLHPPLTWLCGYIKLEGCLRFFQHISIVNAMSSPCEGAGFLQPSTSQIGPTPAIWGRQDPPTATALGNCPAPGHPSQPTSWGWRRCPTASSRQSSRWYLCPSPPQQICTHRLHTPIDVPIPSEGRGTARGGRVGGRLCR